ncbi:hypothetical protein QAD02_012515 [Eretmocerus hayati]|uniref:Uncharacterized protein n=1 Tax=Eretmocerus hayati TaxID=131215 RepID=A0ACC2P0T2_9HYME|nr:hypothetical protein QAD02_012515 [Eretmocerus hayati]
MTCPCHMSFLFQSVASVIAKNTLHDLPHSSIYRLKPLSQTLIEECALQGSPVNLRPSLAQEPSTRITSFARLTQIALQRFLASLRKKHFSIPSSCSGVAYQNCGKRV